MKSYIKTETVTLYSCDLCGYTWDNRREGWENPDSMPGDGTPPKYEEREFPRAGGGSIRAMVEVGPPEGDYGKSECPACGGSRPEVVVEPIS